MIETFVYPQHPNFEPYRELAETAELKVGPYPAKSIGCLTNGQDTAVYYEPVDVPYDLAFGYRGWNLKNAPEWTLVPGAARNNFWRENGGIDTLSFYKSWAESYVNKGHRIMSRTSHFGGRTPQANEIITHGVGTLRPMHGEHNGLRSFLGETAVRVDSSSVQQQGVYIVDKDVNREGEWMQAPTALESTNLIMPEIVGELSQLQTRRDETDFINSYFRDLLETFKPLPVYAPSSEGELAPASIAHIKPAWRLAHQNHLRTGLWSEPPKDSSELLDRVDELIDRIVIDKEPVEIGKKV